MQVPIEEILIKERVRTDIGNLKPLMESMRLHGQLNPVTISRENELIAGHRRTLAARELGWKFIDAHVVDRPSEVEKLQMELEENVHRKDFSPEELLAGYRRLDKLLHPSLSQRISTAVRSFFGRLFRRKPRKTLAAEPPTKASPLTEPLPRETTAEKEPDVIGSQFGI